MTGIEVINLIRVRSMGIGVNFVGANPNWLHPKLGEKLTSTLAKDTEVNEKELSAWMDKHAAIYRELETTYNEMSGYWKEPKHHHRICFVFECFLCCTAGIWFCFCQSMFCVEQNIMFLFKITPKSVKICVIVKVSTEIESLKMAGFCIHSVHKREKILYIWKSHFEAIPSKHVWKNQFTKFSGYRQDST